MCAICKEERDFDWLICKMPQELTSGDQKKNMVELENAFFIDFTYKNHDSQL